MLSVHPTSTTNGAKIAFVMGSSQSRSSSSTHNDSYTNLKTPANRGTFFVAPPADTNSGRVKGSSKLAKYSFATWEDQIASTGAAKQEVFEVQK